MLTYTESVELRERLLSGDITLAHAKEMYWKDFKEGQRSWHTTDWKERRIQVLKEKCEICASRDTLTIQHLSHPRTYADFEREVTRKYTQILTDADSSIDKDEFKAYIITKYDYQPVPLCPSCGDNRPSMRVRKLPVYRCTECRYEFNEPIYKSLDELITKFHKNEEAFELRDKCFVSKDQWKNQQNIFQIKYWFQREMAKIKDIDIIGKEAFLLYLDDNIKYLSFEDSITACRRCAANYDLRRMELCPQCKEHYKGIAYPTCIPCLPEDKRKKALESIEFGKQLHAMHKDLGID